MNCLTWNFDLMWLNCLISKLCFGTYLDTFFDDSIRSPVSERNTSSSIPFGTEVSDASEGSHSSATSLTSFVIFETLTVSSDP
uniref:Putative secreted protein n=1 Tax=Anopheles triannulatus TaxID=58253 RepID=A0A2M4B6G1_9DIPT